MQENNIIFAGFVLLVIDAVIMAELKKILSKFTSSQLNMRTKRPTSPPNAFTDSVFPVPAGPKGFPTRPRCSD